MKLTATFSRLFLVAIAVVLVGQQAFSQDIESKYKRYSWNSGAARNPMMTTKVIARHQVQIERGLGGFRLHFAKNQIGNGIAIQISTPADHQRFILTDKALAMYEYSTPYLNGEVAYVEILARGGASTRGVSIVAIEGLVGKPLPPQESICGSSDDRQASQSQPFARMMQSGTSEGGCTGTMISETCMVSAGHCVGSLNIAQFNVPLSKPNGSPNHPPAEDQYPLKRMYGSQNGGEGRDWSVYSVDKNPVTGKTPGSVQGALKIFTGTLAKNDEIRVTGYGVDDGPANVTQQTHVGKVFSVDGTTLEHTVDTMPGNSGSTIVLERTGEIVGIHTHGGCSPIGSPNAGTLLMAVPNFRSAIDKCLADERAERAGGR